MGSILGALSRAKAILGSAAGAQLAVWECVALSLSDFLIGLFLQPPASREGLQEIQTLQTSEKKEKRREGEGRRRNQACGVGWGRSGGW